MSLRALALAACAGVGCYEASATPDEGGADATIDDGGTDAISCPPGPDAGDLPCDVSAVFQAKCQHCHTVPKLAPPDNAPFPLKTYEDLSAPFGLTSMRRWQRVAEVIEPNNFPHMPLPTAPQLAPSDFDTLHRWFAACAPALPEGTGCDVGEGDASADATSDASTSDVSSSDASSDAASE